MIDEKSFRFAVRVVKLAQHLQKTKGEYVLSKQLLRSGTSIGANLAEARQAQSRADFLSKNAIALKEAAETSYWLRLLHATAYLSARGYASMQADCTELEKILTSIIQSTKANQ